MLDDLAQMCQPDYCLPEVSESTRITSEFDRITGSQIVLGFIASICDSQTWTVAHFCSDGLVFGMHVQEYKHILISSIGSMLDDQAPMCQPDYCLPEVSGSTRIASEFDHITRVQIVLDFIFRICHSQTWTVAHFCSAGLGFGMYVQKYNYIYTSSIGSMLDDLIQMFLCL